MSENVFESGDSAAFTPYAPVRPQQGVTRPLGAADEPHFYDKVSRRVARGLLKLCDI